MRTNRRARMLFLSAAMVLTTSMVGTASQDRAGDGGRLSIAGSWAETVTLAGGASFRALDTFGEGGDWIGSAQGSVVTGPFPVPSAFTAGQGQWIHPGGRTFSTTALSLASDLTDGHLLFVFKIRQTVTLNGSGNGYRSVIKLEIFDPAGNPLAAIDGTTEARRIRVEPLN